MTGMFQYRGRAVHVVDGDTIDVDVDLGFRIVMRQRIRLAEVDAPERGHMLWGAARDFTDRFVRGSTEDWPLILETFKPSDKYGRWLAHVTRADSGQSLATSMLAQGYARRYDGGHREPWMTGLSDDG